MATPGLDGRLVRAVVAFVALLLIGLSVLMPSPPRALASCSGYYSDSTPPAQIKVFHNNPLRGGDNIVYTRDFDTYVKESLPWEWKTTWNTASLQAGAMAVRNFAWWHVQHGPAGYYLGQCYDIDSTDSYQVWAPCPGPYCNRTGATDSAVDSIWPASRMTKASTLFDSHYQLGNDDDPNDPTDPFDGCGQYYLGPAGGYWMSGRGTQSCALQAEVWATIVRRYYFDNATQPGHVAVLDDAAAVTEYHEGGGVYGLRVWALNGDGRVRYRTYTRSTNSWWGWFVMSTDDGLCSSHPASMSYGANELWVLCRGGDAAIWARRWNGSAWGGWFSLGGVAASGPAATAYGSQLTAFTLGTNMHVFKRLCDVSTSSCSLASNWTAWTDEGSPAGGCTSSPAAGWRPPAELYVFCRTALASSYPKAPVSYRKWNAGNPEAWTTVPGGDIVSGPAASDFYDGAWKVVLLANTEGGHVWANQRSSSWGGWYQPWLDGYCTSTPGTSNLPPTPEYFFVVCRGGGGNFYSRRWNGSSWLGWVNLGFP